MRQVALLVGLMALCGVVAAQERPLREVIDAEIKAAWEREKVTPAAVSSDAEFLRRVSLDLIGVIPTWEEAVAFLDDPSPDKRSRLIDRLLEDPRYARHQADIWDLVLFGRNPPGSEADRRDGIQSWLQRQFAQNVPYDQWARTLLKAEGNSVDDGPPLFFVQYRNQPEDASEAVSQIFLGVQLQCARCHDHPFESWSQLDFYGMAAFLARLQVVSVGKQDDLTKYMIGEKNSGDILFTGPAFQAEPGKKGDPVKPKFLHGEPLAEPELPADFKEGRFEDNKPPAKPNFSRKDQLAEWITHPENPYFARAIANRVWAQFLGRGLVHPVDNMSESNPPSHPQLLDQLTKDLVAHKFDLKWYIREIVNSQAYQLSSQGSSGEPMPLWFQHGRMRPLSAEELFDSWSAATWYPASAYAASQKPGKNRFHPISPDYMRRYFGTPNTGAGDFQGGLHEHLFLNNGPLTSLVSSGKGSLADWLAATSDPLEVRIERMYLSAFTRRPAAEEVERLKALLEAPPGQSPRWHDAVWALVTSSEFRFNH